MRDRTVSVTFQPWSGDLPTVYFSIGEFVIVSNGKNRTSSWTVHTDFKKVTGPKWAFLLTNGRDEIYTRANAGRCYVSLRTRGSLSEASIEITPAEGTKLRATFEANALATQCKFGSRKAGVALKPLGVAVNMTSTTRVLSAHA